MLPGRLGAPLNGKVHCGSALVEAYFRAWARRCIVAWRMVGTQQQGGYKCHCIDSHPARPASGCSVEMFVLFAAVWKAVGRVAGIRRTCVSVVTVALQKLGALFLGQFRGEFVSMGYRGRLASLLWFCNMCVLTQSAQQIFAMVLRGSFVGLLVWGHSLLAGSVLLLR